MELETLFCLRHLAVMGLKLLDLPSQLLHVLDGVSQYRRLVHFGHEGDQRPQDYEPLIQLLAAAALGQHVVRTELVLRRPLAAELGVRRGMGRTLAGVLGVEVRDREEDVLEEPLAGAVRRRVEVVAGAAAPFCEC